MGISCDAIVGAGEAAINKLIVSIFTNAPGLFTQQILVNNGGLGTIEMIVRQPPVMSLQPSAELRNLAAAHIKEFVPDELAENALAELTGSSVSLTCPDVLVFDLNTGKGGEASFACDGILEVAAGQTSGITSSVYLHLTQVKVTIPGNPELSEQYTTFFSPAMLSFMNEYIIPIVQVPAAFSFGGITLSTPVIVEGSDGTGNFVSACSNLISPAGSGGVSVSLDFSKTSIGFDGAVLNAGIDALNLQANYGSSGGIPTPNFSWDYHVTVTPQGASLSNGSMELSLGISGGANFTYHTIGILPNLSFSGSLGGSCSASARLSTRPNGLGMDLVLELTSLTGFSIQPSFDGLPSAVNGLIGDIFGPLTSEIGDLVGNNLAGNTYTLFTISSATFNTSQFGGASFTLQNPAISITSEMIILEGDLTTVPKQ